MRVTIHTDFEKENMGIIMDRTNEKIREFCEWASKSLPDHVSAVIIAIDRKGFTVTTMDRDYDK